MNDENPVIYGSGLQKRDFTHVDNICHAILLACNKKEYEGNIFDVGCNESTSLLDLLSIIQKKMKTNKKPIFKPARIGDVFLSKADLRSISQVFDYKPIVSLEEGLEKTIEYYLSKRSSYKG